MNAEQQQNACGRHQMELVRVMWEQGAEPSAALRAHLASCPLCREELDAARELAAPLRAALRPEALREGLEAEIRARVVARSTNQGLPWALRVGTAAVAAALLLAVLVPHSRPTRSTAEVTLSADDAAVIASTYTLLNWESPLEDSVEYLSTRIKDATQRVERQSGAPSTLPWGPEDDWDLPVGDEETSRIRAGQRLCAAPPRVPIALRRTS